MKTANGRFVTEANDVRQPDEFDNICMRQAHEALQSVFDQAIAMGHQHRISAITVRKDNKNDGYYSTAKVTHFICGKSKTQQPRD